MTDILSKRFIATLMLFACVAGVAPFAMATEPVSQSDEEGWRIALEEERRDNGFGDSIAALKMILMDQRGKRSERELTIKTFEMRAPGVGDKTIVVFASPRDIEGTALLTHANILEPDDQWLFLPALKRVKRISAANKSGPFMGSEFAYEDMAAQDPDKYTHRYLRDAPCQTGLCYVVERRPRYAHSGYQRLLVWLDQQEYRPQRIEFYDRGDTHLKTLTFADYRQYLGQFWRAHELRMENHQTGKSTVLLWSAFAFQTGQSENQFTRARLRLAK